MNRKTPLAVLFLIPLLACLAQPVALKPRHLKSGRTIFPKQLGPMIAPNMPAEKIMVCEYQTQLKIDNLNELTLEARDVWDDIRPDMEKIKGITTVILQADEAPEGKFIQHNRNYRFVITRKADGSWEWVIDKSK